VKKSLYTIPLKGAGSAAEGVFQFDIDSHFFNRYEGSEILEAQVEVSSILKEEYGVIEIESFFKGTIVSTCDLCLERVTFPIEFSNLLLVKSSTSEECDDQSEVLYITKNEKEVDMAQYFYDLLYLSLPVQRRHPTGECNLEMLKKFEEIRVDRSVDIPSPFEKLKDIFN